LKYLILSLICTLLCTCPSKSIKVGKGRISLIDLGSQIKSNPSIAQTEFINVYPLSAEIDRKKKTVLAIQGLQEQGETSFFINTEAGVQNIEVELDENSSETQIFDANQQKTQVFEKTYHLNINSSLRVASPYYINDYVLAGDPDLMSLDPFSNYYDENYLKNFIINAKELKAKTDIIVPTTRQIFKFTIQIDNFKGGYDSVINLI
jgi:hypothetical protein